jgi:CHAT domain-containing protein/tetratricopeptide (TPR) repeat protein
VRSAIVLMLASTWVLAPVTRADERPSGAGNERRLTVGERVEREIAAGQAHAYQVDVPVGNYFHADVEQRGIDVSVSLFDPAGNLLSEIDSPTGTSGSESVSLVAKTEGTYRFTVHVGQAATAPPGRYVVTATEMRAATAADASRVAAEYAANAGLPLWLEETDEGRTAALAKYAEALADWRKAGDQRGEANTLGTIGAIRKDLRQPDAALEAFRAELSIRRTLADREGEAVALNNIGVVFLTRGDFQQALVLHQQALDAARKANSPDVEGLSLTKLAQALSGLGRKKDALAAVEPALPLLHEHGEPGEEAEALTVAGAIRYDLGDRAGALEAYTRAVPLWAAANEADGQSAALRSAGSVYADRGEWEKALLLYKRALALSQASDDELGLARIYDAMGASYDQLGERPEAISNYLKAFALACKSNDAAEQGRILNNIGGAFASMGRGAAEDDRHAVAYFDRALRIWRTLHDPYDEANTLVNLGRLYLRTGALARARTSLARSLALCRSTGNRSGEAVALKLTGDAYSQQRSWRAALASYDRALAISREAGIAGSDATVLLGMARAERDRGNLAVARTRIEAAIDIVETVRLRVASRDLRASFFADAQVYYDVYVDLLMRMHAGDPSRGYDGEALRVSERARARSLIELLSGADAEFPAHVDPALAARVAWLRDELDAKAQEQINISLTPGGDAEALNGKIDALVGEYESAMAEVAAADPHFAGVSRALTLADIQRQVLDADTALLEYWLGEERSYAWVVTPGSIKSYVLPPRRRVESAARELFDELSQPRATTGEPGEPSGNSERARERAPRADQAYLDAAVPLSRIVLEPVWADLGAKRILVVADGALDYIPFGALPVPSAAGGSEPLLVEREVVYAPSASTIAVIRRERAVRATAPKLIAMFADPVFDPGDERIKRVAGGEVGVPSAQAPNPSAELTREIVQAGVAQAATDTGEAEEGARIPRLPFTCVEAEAVEAVAGRGQSEFALDFAANRTAATSQDLSQYRIVHFATHGYLNALHPELSGLVLSLVDERGKPQAGFLTSRDVFGLKLAADLVVLSACRTGLGKEVRGEGLVGLTRAFMYAGSPRVIVSLWSVNDQATAELMKRFYEEMLTSEKSPAAALRAAQVAIWEHEGWRAPFYWAPFVLQGEWQ